jgi:uncharacterized protein (TIGR02757 family)
MPSAKRLAEIKELLDEKVLYYNRSEFIEFDPVFIPHLFSKKEDIEISAFLAATIAWGQRPTIIRNAKKLMQLMDNAPHDFIIHFEENDLPPFRHFVHRTFNGTDCIYFLKALKNIYLDHGGFSEIFTKALHKEHTDIKQAIVICRNKFFEKEHPKRTEKHFSNPQEGAACKRINMFLRWMVRKDCCGVDFGIWNHISPSILVCPLDVHSGRIARKIGLLKRKQNDWRAVQELTEMLKKFDPSDPVKYDFALFGLGAIERL